MVSNVFNEKKNPEDIATTLMNDVIKGDRSQFDKFLKNGIKPEVLGYVLEQLKELGNNAFRTGKYNEALDYYNQALAGLTDPKEKAAILSNISAAYLNDGKLSEALDAARETIRVFPNWSKGWFRAARVFFEQKSYSIALTVLKVALKKDTTNQSLQKWIKILEPLVSKEKSLERLSIDYKRFEQIPVDELCSNETVETPGNEHLTDPIIEFDPNLSKEEKAKLEMVLKGQTGIQLHPTDTSLQRRKLLFNLEKQETIMYLNHCKKKKQYDSNLKDKIHRGLLNLLHTQSELMCPRQIVLTQLLRPTSIHLLNQYITMIRNIPNTLPSIQSHPIKWFFLGCGTSIPLIAAAQLCQLAKNNYNQEYRIICCTNHQYPFLTWMAERMLEINNLTDLTDIQLRCVTKKVKDLTIVPNEIVHDPLETEIVDVSSGKASILVLDTDLFDSTGIGRGALIDIHETRTRLVVENANDGLIVIPARMRMRCYGATIGNPSPQIDKYITMESIDEALWNIYWESIELMHCHSATDSSKSQTPIHSVLTEYDTLFEFTFDGPLENLHNDIPLNKTKFGCLTANASGKMNAFVIITEFCFKHTNSTTNINDDYDSNTNDNIWYSGAANPGILWVDTTHIDLGTHIPFEAILTPTRLKVNLLEWKRKFPICRNASLPRWQFEIFYNTKILQDLNGVLADAIKERLEETLRQLDSRPHLLSSKTKKNVEVLLFNSSLGSSVVTALHTVADRLSTRVAQPNPSFHVCAIEPSTAHAWTTHSVALQNATCCIEENIARETEHACGGVGLQWKSFNTDKFVLTSDNELLRKDTSINTLPNNSETIETKPIILKTDNVTSKIIYMEDTEVKKRMKNRLSILTKDPRAIRPPVNEETGLTKLALMRLLNISNGTQLPPSNPDDHLLNKADIVMTQMIDCGLLGEGILPILLYSKEALTKPKSTIIPSKARICAAVISLTHQRFQGFTSNIDVESIRADCWYPLLGNTMQAMGVSTSSDYISIRLDSIPYKLMTDPIVVFEFDFEHLTPDKKDFITSSIDMNIPVLETGSASAVIFWYDLLFESVTAATRRGLSQPRGVSTKPRTINQNMPAMKGWEFQLPQMQYPLQACHLLEDTLFFKKEEELPLTIWHTTCNIGVKWNQLRIPDFNIRCCTSAKVMVSTRVASAWASCYAQHNKTFEQMETIYNNKEAMELASEEVANIAKDPGRFSNVSIDPAEAAWFFLTFYC